MSSRRGAEALLRAGRVRVNGIPARLGDSADAALDRIEVDGRRLRPEQPAYWLVHKPRGIVTTRRDPEGRPTVMGLLPAEARRLRLFPVGRLDLESEGLVLLTNDGALAQRLLHPSFESEKEYVVTARGDPSPAALRRLAAGLRLDPGERPTAPARVAVLVRDSRRGEVRLRVVLHEGRKRQIRRSLFQLGHPVLRLVRVRIGTLRLRGMPPGGARALTVSEQASLLAHAARRAASAQLTPQAKARAVDSRRGGKLRGKPGNRRKTH
jgi:23S rRNA pseudouridine2605 synthase